MVWMKSITNVYKYICIWITVNRGGSYIVFPEWIKDNDDKCFQTQR